jgi:glycosyltransferase involved in cell wall biosynthesis
MSRQPAAVFTFFNTISGQYSFWDDFATLVGEGLRRRGIENLRFRRGYNEQSGEPPQSRFPTPEGSLGNLRWLRDNIRPAAARFEKVIFHTHGHYQPILLGQEVWRHRRARWFWTEHRISDPGRLDWAKKAVREVGQGLRVLPHRMYGVSQAGATRLRQQFRNASVRCIRTGIRLRPDARPKVVAPGFKPIHGLFVGRLIEEKGFWTLLRAYSLLAARGVEATLTIVGPGPLEEIGKFLRENGLEGRVRVAGYQKDPGPFYEQADFVIIPTLVAEALGMVSLEARMYGLPVIYSRRGGLPETQVEGTTGLALGSVTAEEIAAKVVELQARPDRYAEMSRAAPGGLESFTIDRMIDAYVEDYVEALAAM